MLLGRGKTEVEVDFPRRSDFDLVNLLQRAPRDPANQLFHEDADRQAMIAKRASGPPKRRSRRELLRRDTGVENICPFERQPHTDKADELRPLVYRLRAGTVSPAEALRISITVLARWRGFPTVDPDLPASSLPPDWPRREARRLFTEIYDECTPLAELHVKNVIAKYDRDCADLVKGLTVEQTIDHYFDRGRIPHAKLTA